MPDVERQGDDPPVKDLLERLTEWVMAGTLAIMVVMVFGNVVLRYVFHTGIAAAEEIARLMFVWLVFLGGVLALRHNQHLGFTLLQSKLPPRWRRACAILAHGLMFYALALMIVGAWRQTVIGLGIYSTVLRFPMALYASAPLLPGIAMAVLVLLNLARIVTNSPKARIAGDPETWSTLIEH